MVVMYKDPNNWQDIDHRMCAEQGKSRGVTFDTVDVIELDSLEECIVFDDDGDEDDVNDNNPFEEPEVIHCDKNTYKLFNTCVYEWLIGVQPYQIRRSSGRYRRIWTPVHSRGGAAVHGRCRGAAGRPEPVERVGCIGQITRIARATIAPQRIHRISGCIAEYGRIASARLVG